MIGISGVKARARAPVGVGLRKAGRGFGVGVAVFEQSLPVGKTLMESAICSWMAWSIITSECTLSRSLVTSEGPLAGKSEIPLVLSNFMAPRAAASLRQWRSAIPSRTIPGFDRTDAL